jgi:hypothetical protein
MWIDLDPRLRGGDNGRSHSRPALREESIPQTFGNELPTGWIPAFAGMTGGFEKDPIPNDASIMG